MNRWALAGVLSCIGFLRSIGEAGYFGPSFSTTEGRLDPNIKLYECRTGVGGTVGRLGSFLVTVPFS